MVSKGELSVLLERVLCALCFRALGARRSSGRGLARADGCRQPFGVLSPERGSRRDFSDNTRASVRGVSRGCVRVRCAILRASSPDRRDSVCDATLSTGMTGSRTFGGLLQGARNGLCIQDRWACAPPPPVMLTHSGAG